MQSIAAQLQKIMDSSLTAIQRIPEEEFNYKSSPKKWSKKEILGHLIDSAQNNIRRFIVVRYLNMPIIKYNQDVWVEASNYQQWNKTEIIELWYLLNRQLCHILSNTPDEFKDRQCLTEELHTIEWLAVDYIKHLQHHLHVVLDLEPVAYP